LNGYGEEFIMRHANHDKDSIMDTLYNNLSKKIRQTGMEKKEVARRKGIAPETLSRHCSGKIHLTRKDADEYAQILGCRSAEILYPLDPHPIIGKWSISNYCPTNPQLVRKYEYGLCLQMSNTEVTKCDMVYLRTLYSRQIGVFMYDFTAEEYAKTGFPQTPWWTPSKLDIINVDYYNKGVDKNCFQNLCYCMTSDELHLWGYLYPEPEFNRYTVHVPKTLGFGNVQTQTGVELKWACPVLGSIFRPDLRDLEIVPYEA